MTAAYVFASASDAAKKFSGAAKGNVYSRFSNPTVQAFEKRVAAMEHAEAGCRPRLRCVLSLIRD